MNLPSAHKPTVRIFDKDDTFTLKSMVSTMVGNHDGPAF